MNKIVYILIAIVIFIGLAALLTNNISKKKPAKEKFIVDQHLTRIPVMRNEETHDVLAYSLGY